MPPWNRYLLAGVFLGLGLLMLVWRKGPNSWIGVRLPWTYADREIWDKSWRLAAIFLVAMGLGALFSREIFFISLAHLLILGLGYPVFLYRRKYGTFRYWKKRAWGDYRPVACCPRCGHLQKLANARELAGGQCEACGALLAR